MSIPPPGKRIHKKLATFRMEHGISANIRAPADRLWSLLTNAADFPRWNSTVSSIEGNIVLGQRLCVRVPSSRQEFKLRVTELEPNKRMVWTSGVHPMFKGVRTFTLVPLSDGSTEFAMDEVFSGLLLPLIKGSLPDFGPIFEQYASDLKREAERAR